MSREVDLAYCAGIIDGEGCIRIKRTKAYKCAGRRTPGYHVLVQVRMVELGAIEHLCKTLGGWYYTTSNILKSRRPIHCWQMSDLKAEAAIRAVQKHLKVKHLQADVSIRLRELRAKSRKHRTKVVGSQVVNGYYGGPRTWNVCCLSDEFVALCDDLYMECKRLNRVGKAALT